MVTSVDLETRSLVGRTPEGVVLRMGADETGSDKLAHGYAITAHRSQGATVDVTYAFEDGGGRELAYVAMSRARGESHVHVVAPDLSQAASRLAWAWEDERRQAWSIGIEAEKPLVELYAKRVRLSRLVPPDYSHQLDNVRHQSDATQRDIADLYNGDGRWAHTSTGRAARAVRAAAVEHQRVQALLESSDLGRWSRHKARRALAGAAERFDKAVVAWEITDQPYATRLEAQRERLGAEVALLEQARLAGGVPHPASRGPEPPRRARPGHRARGRKRAPAQLGAIEGARARTQPRHFSGSRPGLRHRTVTPARIARRESAGARATPRPTTLPRRAWSNQPPLDGGADRHCPVGAPPPVKSQNLGLRHPWLRPRTSRPGSCNFDRLAVRLPESAFAPTARQAIPQARHGYCAFIFLIRPT